MQGQVRPTHGVGHEGRSGAGEELVSKLLATSAVGRYHFVVRFHRISPYPFFFILRVLAGKFLLANWTRSRCKNWIGRRNDPLLHERCPVNLGGSRSRCLCGLSRVRLGIRRDIIDPELRASISPPPKNGRRGAPSPLLVATTADWPHGPLTLSLFCSFESASRDEIASAPCHARQPGSAQRIESSCAANVPKGLGRWFCDGRGTEVSFLSNSPRRALTFSGRPS